MFGTEILKKKHFENIFFFSSSQNHELHITVSNNGRMFKWIEPWVLFDVSRNGYQTLTIPVSAEYTIELVAPGNTLKVPGVRIIGKFKLLKGQKITAVLGQQGSDWRCGSGGSFLVLESHGERKPLLIAGGAGAANNNEEFARGNIKQAAVDNENVCTCGELWEFLAVDKKYSYNAGAGYYEAAQVSNIAPKSYKDGLTGGKGVNQYRRITEGGFGGGGAFYYWVFDGDETRYYGAGGGFTGGTTKVCCGWSWGGGGGSFSADPNAEFDHHNVEYGYCKIKKL